MSATFCAVGDCARPANLAAGSPVCVHHGELLTRALAEMTALADALDTFLARQRGITYGGGSPSSTPRLPFDYRTSEAGYALRNTLVAWVRDLRPDPRDHPHDTLHALGRWLYARAHELLVHPAAGEAVEEILAVVEHATRAIDNPPERRFIGRCPCGMDVTTTRRAGTVTCECGAAYDVEGSRAALVEDMDATLVSAAEAAGLLAYLGLVDDRERTRKRIDQWGARDVVPRHAGPGGERRYRFGDLHGRITGTDHP